MASLAFSRKVACPSTRAVRPAQRASLRLPSKVLLASVIVRAEPSKIETAIKEAEEACASGTTGECAAAWDTVEEVSAAASHKKDAEKANPSDPLEAYCDDNPDADECRVYE